MFPWFVPPSFDLETMANMTKSRFMSDSQRSDQDTRTQMEGDSGEPFATREISTKTNLVTKTKTGTNLITETRTNMTKVEKFISLKHLNTILWHRILPPRVYFD